MADTAKHTELPWGVSVFDKDFATGEPRAEGAMIVSPPPREAVRRVQARELPFTSRRVALLEVTRYIPHAVAVANAELIVKAVNCHADLLAACEEARSVVYEAVMSNVDLPDFDAKDHVVVKQLDAAIAKAKGT